MRRRLWLAPFVSLWLWGGLGLVLPARAQPQRAQWETTALTTFYTLTGYTASGTWTHAGTAACSDDLPLGTVVSFLGSGDTVVCEDRGLLGSGSPTRIDVWAPDGWQTVAPWGQYRRIEVQ